MKHLVLFMAFMCLSALSAAQEIKPLVHGSYQEIVAARSGKPFIVNFWSLSCSYCKVELAMFKKLLKKHPRLDLVLVSTDTPEEQAEVRATLKQYKLGKAQAWVYADSYTERLRFEVDKSWQGELPRSYFYGANGERLAFSGKLEQAEVEQWIKQQGL